MLAARRNSRAVAARPLAIVSNVLVGCRKLVLRGSGLQDLPSRLEVGIGRVEVPAEPIGSPPGRWMTRFQSQIGGIRSQLKPGAVVWLQRAGGSSADSDALMAVEHAVVTDADRSKFQHVLAGFSPAVLADTLRFAHIVVGLFARSLDFAETGFPVWPFTAGKTGGFGIEEVGFLTLRRRQRLDDVAILPPDQLRTTDRLVDRSRRKFLSVESPGNTKASSKTFCRRACPTARSRPKVTWKIKP